MYCLILERDYVEVCKVKYAISTYKIYRGIFKENTHKPIKFNVTRCN